MKAVLGFFKKRWVISLLGLLALCLVVWFVGPLIAIAGKEPLISPVVRLVVILVLVLIWGANNLRRQAVANKANREIAEGLVDSDADAGHDDASLSADEVAVLQQRFEEAVTVLKKSRKDGVGLYDLPWYIIIGPPGSGKTTALVNSGLNFPLAERFGKEALRGVGGTRNCDWWFTDDAVLLDTAGRYVTQDSHASVDSAAWSGFLDLLKRFRKRRPINGVFVAISLSDLMTGNEAQRASHIKAIRNRVNELYEHFGIRFPVYVLLTKCDLIAGFMEFFDDLGAEERAQVFGMTFPLHEGDGAVQIDEAFSREYDGLLQRLHDRSPERLHQERDLQRRTLIFGFPRQMAALKPVLTDFLKGIFGGSRYEEQVLLRGVYFTSGTQEGTPIDRIMGSLARTFGLGQQALPAFGGPGRSYFINAPLKRVAFAESQLAGTNRRLERRRAAAQYGAYFGIAAAAIAAIGIWVASYFNNKSYVKSVDAQTEIAMEELASLKDTQTSVVATLPALDALRNVPGGYADRDEGTPLLMGFGLYQGDTLGGAAIDTYRRVLGNQFLPRLILRMEQQLRDGGASPDYQFEGLKAYLMLEDAEHFDAEAVKAWILLDWDINLPRSVGTEERQRLRQHLDAQMEKLPVPLPVALDQRLIDDTRRVLMRIPLAERVYGRLKRQRFGADVPPFTIADAGGRDAPLVFQRKSGDPLNEGIPGLYTYKGYHEVFVKESERLGQRVADESWILGDAGAIADQGLLAAAEEPSARDKLFDDVLDLYLKDFGQAYQDLLADLALQQPNNLSEAVELLRLVSDKRFSPLLKLMQAIERETSLQRVESADDSESAAGEAGAKLDEARSALANTLGSVPRAPRLPQLSSRQYRVKQFVDTRFKGIQEQVAPDDAGNFRFQSVMDMLDELYRFLDTVKNDPDAAQAMMQGSGKVKSLVNDLRREAERQPPMVEAALSGVTDAVTGITSGGVRQHLNALWRSDSLGFCQRAIDGRYPLVRNASNEVQLGDFGEFFSPGGKVDQFFRDHLAPYVDTSRTPWRWRAGSDMRGASSQSLAQFERARTIRETFFRGGSSTPRVQFELKPLTMDVSIEQFVLEIEGQQLTYNHGPAVPKRLVWPGDGARQVRIQMAPPAASGPSGMTREGAWAWFRVLDEARMTPAEQQETFYVTFEVGGRSARYELSASSAFNPFRLKELEAFRCPERF